jgi:hypothetical protein
MVKLLTMVIRIPLTTERIWRTCRKFAKASDRDGLWLCLAEGSHCHIGVGTVRKSQKNLRKTRANTNHVT